MSESKTSTPIAETDRTATSAEAQESATELAFAGLETQALMLISREVSSRELVELALKRTEDAQPRLNAFRVIRTEEALAEAEAADRRLAAGDGAPLLGVPVAIKDDVDLGGHTTPFGCGGKYRPAVRDCEAVRRLRKAGAIVIGKTHAPEVGQWHFTETPTHGATRNPWNVNHTPGGSSGGAAAAVAAGLVAGAIGSDGAGSIRIPAAWTGLVGLKPQRGRVSTWPDPEAFNGLSCYGPLTRSVGDAALLLDVIHGNVPADLHRPQPPAQPFSESAASEPRSLRVALSFATPFGVPGDVDPEHRAAIDGVAERLAELGHDVVAADPDYGLVGPALVPRGMAGVEQWLRDNVEDRSLLEPRTRTHARVGKALGGFPLRLSRAAEPALQRRTRRVFDRFDVVLTPTTAKPPPQIGSLEGRGYWATSSIAGAICPFAFAWNVVGWPGLSVPAGFTENGLPIGAQLLGRENDEATLLALGAQLEAVADGEWAMQPPRHQG
jgi:amidase